MCDEYDDAQMKAFWRALTEGENSEIDTENEEAVEKPIALQSTEPLKARPNALVR